MAVYEVVRVGENILRQTARPVPRITPNTLKLLDNMRDTMYHAEGVGLAAPQIGISKRVVVIDVGEGLIELINPEILDYEGTETAQEGCLSVPGVYGDVERSAKVTVKGLNRHGEEIVIEGEGLLARALQHEIDHLEGKLFIDKATDVVRKEKK